MESSRFRSKQDHNMMQFLHQFVIESYRIVPRTDKNVEGDQTIHRFRNIVRSSP